MTENKKLVLPAPSQLGVVVRDLDRAIDYYSKTFGWGPFRSYEFVPAKHWVKGVPTPIRLNIGKCEWGALEFEMIQVLEGEIAHKQFLEENGEGMQHLGFVVDNYDEWIDYLETQGINVLMNAETYVEGEGHIRAAYMETDRIGGILFELMEVRP